VSHSGENCIVVVPGANALLSRAQIDAQQATLAAARVLIAQLETPWPTVVHALALARQSGVTTLLNAAPARTLGADDLAHVDWLIVNETEAQAMTGLPAADAAQAATAAHALRALGPAQVVVSLGAQGLVHAGGGRPARHWPAPRVKAVIDSTGAGDTFVGTLAAALAEGRPADEALQLGQAAAALAITRHGAQPSMPRRAEVLAAATA
jgi:ribokinase